MSVQVSVQFDPGDLVYNCASYGTGVRDVRAGGLAGRACAQSRIWLRICYKLSLLNLRESKHSEEGGTLPASCRTPVRAGARTGQRCGGVLSHGAVRVKV